MSESLIQSIKSFRDQHVGLYDRIVRQEWIISDRSQFALLAKRLPPARSMKSRVLSPRSIAKWSHGETPSVKQEKALVEMDRLLDGLSRVMEPVQVGRWLKQPNTAFDGSTPLQVVERGELDRIWRMLYDLESGQSG